MGFFDSILKAFKEASKPKQTPKSSVKKQSSSKPSIETKVEVKTRSYNDGQVNIDPILTKKLSNGLLPGEVLLIDWITGKKQNVRFPQYYERTYGIKPERSLKKLVKNGYISEATPVESLVSFKLPELKEALKSKQLKVSGKKADLISRISENFSDSEVMSLVGDSLTLKVTEKGEKTLEEYYYIVPAHRNDSKDGVYNVPNAIRHVKKLNYKPNNGDISWALFQQAYIDYAEKRDYGLMRNVILNKAMQLEREKKYESALFQYLRVFIFDTSGLQNGRHLEHPKYAMIPQPMGRFVKVLVKRLDIDETGLRDHFDKTWGKVRGELEFHYLTKDECFRCLLNSITEEEDGTEKVKEQLLKAYDRLTNEFNEKSLRKKYGLSLPIDLDKYD
ncbi:SAP domain-containing protein [Halobacillus dabanensis]|uniref:SAP domain-containing protein n=1 Tax=Halobacillus dabanensis TaxID=240302 RepID=A0A1I3WYB4_HALDA|nr:SAP domain-containing protein [Halobacillus dabanensis]SFK12475.1 SAP domain-containing protein [Halobacillus dabanensis]